MRMRQIALRLVLGGWLLLTLLALLSGFWGWTRLGADIIPPGARDLQVERNGTLKLHAIFWLPPNQSVYDLLQFLKHQGWRRVRTPTVEEGTIVLVRREWSGRVRDVLLVTPGQRDRRQIELRFGRCIAVYRLGCVS